jgi:hypothetical protein
MPASVEATPIDDRGDDAIRPGERRHPPAGVKDAIRPGERRTLGG